MKSALNKIQIVCIALLSFQAVACADDRPIAFDELPANAKTFIAENFPDEKPALITKEMEITGLNYDIVFVSGTKLEFNRSGEWTEIECRHSSVDEKFIPQPIQQKAAELYPEGVKFIKIEIEDGKYEVKLSNGFELVFNKKFVLIEIDD